ncbi:FAD-binding oxidoreductase, partial [Immundisolibacter sp.]|uniref:FAD-binding oxidoreductase n=1 Tax=Immundisolibacter sp. TaxID=1934948 RepID=UPI003566C506
MPEYLPHGVNRDDFQSALAEIRKIVGQAWVLTDSETDLQPYLDHMSAVPPESRMPSAVIAPASVAEVQGVLQIANAYKLPLWTYGNGKNFAYGGPAPKQAGYLVLDLKRMDRILEVNEESGYCVV